MILVLVLILGYANDYSMGYVLTREEYDMGGILGLGGSERGGEIAGCVSHMVERQGSRGR